MELNHAEDAAVLAFTITIDGSQDAASLWSVNRLSDGNDIAIAALLREFDVSFR